MAAGWLHKVRTASGSDRVVSEMFDYAGHYKIWPYWKKRNDCACVSTRSLPLPVLTLCSHAVPYPSICVLALSLKPDVNEKDLNRWISTHPAAVAQHPSL